ncbi:MAG: hypothetical protein QOJ16_3519 [Acidobacteriota bacterium]|nr:hypothetical protein [Acidobacteriota bacterium]
MEGGQALDVLPQAPDLAHGGIALAVGSGELLAAAVPGEAGESPLALALLLSPQRQVQPLRLEAAELSRLLKSVWSLVLQPAEYIAPLFNAATAPGRERPGERGSGTGGKSG